MRCGEGGASAWRKLYEAYNEGAELLITVTRGSPQPGTGRQPGPCQLKEDLYHHIASAAAAAHMAAVTPASTPTWDQGFTLHTSHTIFEGISLRYNFTLSPTRLTKKAKPKLRPNLAWTSLASDPREQGHNYPKPVISDLGHTAHSSTAHAAVWEEKLCLALVLVLDVDLSTYTSALEL